MKSEIVDIQVKGHTTNHMIAESFCELLKSQLVTYYKIMATLSAFCRNIG